MPNSWPWNILSPTTNDIATAGTPRARQKASLAGTHGGGTEDRDDLRRPRVEAAGFSEASPVAPRVERGEAPRLRL